MTKFDLTPHLEPLRRYARVLTRGDCEADDLVQGALLRAVERRTSFREGANLRVWLMAILHNHFIDQKASLPTGWTSSLNWAVRPR